MFTVGDQNITREEAMTLYHELSKALGVPEFKTMGCSDRYSHGAHWHGSRSHLYCSGRSQDAT